MSPPDATARLTYREGTRPATRWSSAWSSRARRTWPRTVCCRCWATGPTSAARTGPTGSAAGWPPPAATRTWSSARCWTRTAYVELWLADAGLTGSPAYADRYAAWLDYFDRLGIEAVGLGWLMLHRAGRVRPSVRIEDWPHPVEQPIAPALDAGLAAVDRLAELTDDDLLATRWDAGRRRGRGDDRPAGRRRSAAPRLPAAARVPPGGRALDTALAGILGACDGELTLGQIVELGGRPARGRRRRPADTRQSARVRTLVVDGFVR